MRKKSCFQNPEFIIESHAFSAGEASCLVFRITIFRLLCFLVFAQPVYNSVRAGAGRLAMTAFEKTLCHEH